jgi:hypothetical protein
MAQKATGPSYLGVLAGSPHGSSVQDQLLLCWSRVWEERGQRGEGEQLALSQGVGVGVFLSSSKPTNGNRPEA